MNKRIIGCGWHRRYHCQSWLCRQECKGWFRWIYQRILYSRRLCKGCCQGHITQYLLRPFNVCSKPKSGEKLHRKRHAEKTWQINGILYNEAAKTVNYIEWNQRTERAAVTLVGDVGVSPHLFHSKVWRVVLATRYFNSLIIIPICSIPRRSPAPP